MLPILAGLGLLLGNSLAVDYVRARERQNLNDALPGLLGKKESYAAGDEGPVQVPGSGLMADPADIGRQFEFARGLLALPGGQRAMQTFAPMLSNAIQSKQWTQQFEQGKSQYEQTEARLTDQFQKTFGLQQEEAQALAQQRLQQQRNWEAQFNEQLKQNAFSRQMEGARLALSKQDAADRKAAAGLGEKIPTGYGVVNTASGASLMPMKGTQDYAKAVAGEGTLTNAIDTINSLMDEYLGPESTTDGGNKVRRGGAGSESFGPAAASMSTKRGAIISAIGAARDLGVLQPADVDRLTKQLPDVGEWTTSNKTWQRAYETVRSEFERKLKTHRAANPWLVPAPPPGYRPIN